MLRKGAEPDRVGVPFPMSSCFANWFNLMNLVRGWFVQYEPVVDRIGASGDNALSNVLETAAKVWLPAFAYVQKHTQITEIAGVAVR